MRFIAIFIFCTLCYLNFSPISSNAANIGDLLGGAVNDIIDNVTGTKNNSFSNDEFANGSDPLIKLNTNRKKEEKSSSPMDDFKEIKNVENTTNQTRTNNYRTTLELIKSVPAKVERSTGKFFNVLSPTPQEDASFARKFVPAFQRATANGFPKNPLKQLELMNKIWKEIGYSYDSTFYHLFSDLTQRQYLQLCGNGSMDTFIPIIGTLEKQELLKDALKSGLISRDSAIAFFQFAIKNANSFN